MKLRAGTDSGEADQENGGGAARFRRRDGGAWTARAGGRVGRWRRVAARGCSVADASWPAGSRFPRRA